MTLLSLSEYTSVKSVGMGLAPIRPRTSVVGKRMGASPIPTEEFIQ
jgi:hypothetical protein